ncbi:lachesin-like isoform X1 [Limulus polyphemus]|uniref:Lachesin-like isoform X1 n=1 Tax=Limulus polyphemus TaxID=6850 RepID=A0ABM1SU34_LIMPO|nr:lachesin-like isoform X1 [Limulus polyphemus]
MWLIVLLFTDIFHADASLQIFTTAEGPEPEFARAVPNVTVPVGRDAQLPCVVDNLGSYGVAWLRVESKTILTIRHKVITRNYRIDLSHGDRRNWILHIKNVQESDKGGYMCQINTVPMKSQVGYLDVVVPPVIIDAESDTDVLAREGSNVTMKCRAKGYPVPEITWKREDGQPVSVGLWQNDLDQDISHTGESLKVTKVSRLHMGAYLCIASNGVQPSISRRVVLHVHFTPMIWVPNQLIGSPVENNVTLECHTEAYPASINYWTTEKGDMLVTDHKYRVKNEHKTYKVQMKLTILKIQPDDFGTYNCHARNSLGSTEGTIRIYEIHPSSNRETIKLDKVLEDENMPLKQADRKSNLNTKESARRIQGENLGFLNESLSRESSDVFRPSGGTQGSASEENGASIGNECWILALWCFGLVMHFSSELLEIVFTRTDR